MIAATVLAAERTTPTAADEPSGALTPPSLSIPAQLPVSATPTATPTASARASRTAARTPTPTKSATPTPTKSSTSATPAPAASPSHPKPIATHSTASHASTPPTHSTSAHGQSLPLGYSTGSATRVLTYVARSYSSTSGTLQAWSKSASGGWVKYGPAIHAWGGSDGLTTHMSESRSATQVGSFSMTQSFGYYSNPGTSLPYFKTQPDDWWISQKGRLYNTHQRCSSHCSFTLGSPNEHLYYETPDYNYAVVININTSPAVYPDGSAVFLHVTEGKPTAGCISIPQSNLVTIMKWLTPSTHPRILIGVG